MDEAVDIMRNKDLSPRQQTLDVSPTSFYSCANVTDVGKH